MAHQYVGLNLITCRFSLGLKPKHLVQYHTIANVPQYGVSSHKVMVSDWTDIADKLLHDMQLLSLTPTPPKKQTHKCVCNTSVPPVSPSLFTQVPDRMVQ